jgi:hypothetical protein
MTSPWAIGFTSANSIHQPPQIRRSLPPLEFELLPAASSPSGLARLRIRPARLRYQAFAAVPDAPGSATRLQELVARLGEICLSPELAFAVLFPPSPSSPNPPDALAVVQDPASVLAVVQDPASVLAVVQDPPDALAVVQDPASVLAAMETPVPPATLRRAASSLAGLQQACFPQPVLTTLRQPLHLAAWRLEAPPRVCLYTGEFPLDPATLDLAALAPHTLSKVLLDDRSKRPTPSRVHLVPDGDDISPAAVRSSLLHHAQTALTSHRERLTVSAQAAVQDHTLEEAIACLIHAPTRNHTSIALHQSPPWDGDHIDSRYHPSLHTP